MKLNAFELVELRLLEQGRATCIDGRAWLRMTVGIVTIVALTICVAIAAQQRGLPDGPVALALTPILAVMVGLTAWWCVAADERTTRVRISELGAVSAE